LKTESGALCCRPHLSAPRRPPHRNASRRTRPLMTGPPSRPGPPVSHPVPRRADPTVLHCRATTPRPRAPRSVRCRADATPPHYSTPCPGPPSRPLSLPIRLHTAPTPPPPSPPLPLKQSRRPPGEIFSPQCVIRLVHPCPNAAHSSPSPRHPPHRFSKTGAPPPRWTPSERRRRPSPSGERPPSCSIPQSTTASSPRWSLSS
jgi:hypothetical protein